MEKYRQFEDQSNGINPFLEASKQTSLQKIVYLLLSVLGLIRGGLFLIGFYSFAIIQSCGHILIIPSLKRKAEVLLSTIGSKILLGLLGIFYLPYKYQKQDSKRIPNIIFSSQSSVIDWLVLIHNYSPKFLWIVKSEDNKTDFFIELSYLEVVSYSLGLKFPSITNDGMSNRKQIKVSEYIDSPNQIPLVIFPENTKTNRQAVLNIRSNLLDDIYILIKKHDRILLRSELIIKPSQLNNTTDCNGYRNLFTAYNQLTTAVQLYSHDIPNDTFSEDIIYDKSKYSTLAMYQDANLQENLMEYNHRNTVNLSAKDHISFLEYYETTNKDKNASYIRKNA